MNLPDASKTGDQQYTDWTGSRSMDNGNAAFPDSSAFNSNLFGDMYGTGINGGAPQPATRLAPTNQVVRRNANQQVAHSQNFLQPWAEISEQMPNASGVWDNSDDDDDLEQKALAAKKDAQGKRKQIPPFVQKLSSFLDESRNTDLIRWSDDGNSFIVVDEDEFAKTLIPELFKHNNYASFVRQLNMYGFHKKVGLTDNSMRASESKKKLPSVYYNKYFKRGRPELLWLIQKPKSSSSSTKRKRDDKSKGEGDSDDEHIHPGMDLQGTARPGDQQQLIMHNSSEIARIRSEVQQMQRQQKYIMNVIQQIKRQNDQFYSQANAYQQLHDRHENSINAILTFLATFYNRTLDKNGPDLNDIFAHAIPSKPQQQHGTVVDVGDFPDLKDDTATQLQRMRRPPLALLPAPNPKELTPGTATTIPTSARSTASPAITNQDQFIDSKRVQESTSTSTTPRPVNGTAASAASVSSPPLKTDAETPNLLAELGQLQENDDIMSMIRAANSNPNAESPSVDFSSALSHLQNANSNMPLTPEQRDNMLALMANNAGNNGGPLIDGSNNALISPTPPSFPPLGDLSATRNQIDMLEKLQIEQARKVNELADRLQPLSPNGSIPGLGEEYNFNGNGLGNPSELDLNSFINDEYFPPTGVDTNQHVGDAFGTNEIPFEDIFNDVSNPGNFDDSGLDASNIGTNNGFLGDDLVGGTSRVESVSSEATSPARTIDNDFDTEGSANKKRKIT